MKVYTCGWACAWLNVSLGHKSSYAKTVFFPYHMVMTSLSKLSDLSWISVPSLASIVCCKVLSVAALP